MKTSSLLLILVPLLSHASPVETDLLIVGGDESGCAAAIQAARLGVRRIVLTNDIQWLGGQFSTQGIGPMDEWTLVNGKRVNFPRSGQFQEIIGSVRAHNTMTYGIGTPGNSWCGTDTIEPKAAARLFEDRLSPYTENGTGQIRILRSWEPVGVQKVGRKVTGVTFARPDRPQETLEVRAALTVDSSDWGDVIRLSGARYMAGPDLKSRFKEPGAPESLAEDSHQEMNPITWCVLLREAGEAAVIARPDGYDDRFFTAMAKVPPWREWDGSGGIYNFAGWCVYTHRRMVDRVHFSLRPGSEAVVLNWPVHDYPLCNLPKPVVDALEKLEEGSSRKNIVDMTPAQRRVIYEDAKRHSLGFLYYLQTAAHERVGDYPRSFRYMKLAEDYGTPDKLPPKPYIREGLRMEALYNLKEQDIRTESNVPLWAAAMVPDGVFGFQFNMDFHPTRRRFVDGDTAKPWAGEHVGSRNWSTHTDRAMLPLRSLVPIEMDGLLGASKNIGVTSMVQSALRLHGQMTHVGTAVGCVAALALERDKQPREIAASMELVREVQRRMVRGSGGPGTLIWPYHDLSPGEPYFEAANLLAVLGIWKADKDSVYFAPEQPVTRREVAASLARLCRAIGGSQEWPDYPAKQRFSDLSREDPDCGLIEALFSWGAFEGTWTEFKPDAKMTWQELNQWFRALRLPEFPSLGGGAAKYTLTRSECVDYLYRVLQQRGEVLPKDNSWLTRGGDHDGDGIVDYEDPLPFDRDNDNVSDRLQAPSLRQSGVAFGRRVLVSDYGGDKVAIVAADGRVEWSYPAEKPQDVWMLASGNVLFSHLRGAREVSPDKKVVWEYGSPEGTEVHGCQPLSDGGVLVVECGTRRLVEVDRGGRVTREITIPVRTKNTHNQMRGCRRTRDGRYWVCAKGDRAVLELGADGKLTREIKTPGDPHEVRELPNGNVMIACGEGEAVIEMDREGRVVWKLGPSEVPENPLRLVSGFQRLPDGNTLVVNWLGHGYLATTAQFFELNTEKKIVRQFTDHGRFVSINKVQVLDVEGDPGRDEVWR